jgi:hypothetical protein
VALAYKLPFQLAFKRKSSTGGYTDPTNTYDVAIGGIPFTYGIEPNSPLLRSTAQFRKDQLDVSVEPGEQSLTGWWIRSQSSFHWGEGLKYGDPELDDSAAFRYESSEGVDVWTEGQVTMLPRTQKLKSAVGPILLASGIRSGSETYYRVAGDDVLAGGSDGTEVTVLTGSGDNITDIVCDGDDVYVSTLAAITKIPHGSGSPSEEWTYTAANHVQIGFVKQRIIAGVDNKIYQPTIGETTLPTEVYSHPNESWTWTGIDEGPEAIYISGFVGSESCIIRLTLDSSGAVPMLTNATVVTNLPSGEIIHCIKSYLGAYLAIGTSKGVRIAQILQGGRLEAGPLIETPSPVKSLVARGTYFLAGYSNGMSDGTSGLLRIDLSFVLPSGRFPYATHLRSHINGEVTSIVILGTSDHIVFGITDSGVWREHDTELEVSGFLQTAKHRYNTVWPKLFKRLNVRGEFQGPCTVSTIDTDGIEVSIVSLTESVNQELDIGINYPDDPQESLALRFTFNRSETDATIGTVLRSYQLKAIPGGPRPRQITIPLLCYDFESDENGNKHGHKGYSLDRLSQIEDLDSAGDAVLFQELKIGRSALCTIEQIEFRQSFPYGRDGNNYGGLLTVVLRTLST